MTRDLQQNRYDQLIRRVGGIVGPGSKVAEALSELFPVIDVERVPGELLILGGTQICFGSARVDAAVAERPTVQIFNPAGSGKIVTLSTAIVSASLNGNIVAWQPTETELADLQSTARFRDTRLGFDNVPSAQIRSDSIAGAVGRIGQYSGLANTPYMIQDDNSVAVLAPGTGLEFQANSTDTILTVAFYWRERVAEQSELLFP